jgi:toxin ParE1/3/4
VKGYRLNSDAEGDVEAIIEHIAESSVDAALRVYNALEEAFELLAENPGIGHRREDLTARPVKFWSVFSYIVIYRPEKRPIEVLAVLHGARDIPRVLGERAQ